MNRDGFTWLAYAAMALFGFVLYGSGVITGLVRAELGLGYLATSILPVVFTGCAIVSGALSGVLNRGQGDELRELRIIAGFALAVTAGVAALAVPMLPATVLGLGLLGFGGGAIPPTTGLLLSRRYGSQAGRALLELNVAAPAFGILASGAFGIAQSLVGWRVGLVVPVAVAAGVAVGALRLLHHTSSARAESAAPDVAPPPAGPMPTATRWYVGVAVVGGTIEFGVVYWAADLLVTTTGLTPAAAASGLAAFTAGMVVGRAGLSVLARSHEASQRLLLGSLGVAAGGAGVLLAVEAAWAAIAALVLVGIGVAALFPLAFTLAVASAGTAAAKTSSVLAVSVGVASLVAPLGLAAVADVAGMRLAFGALPLAALAGVAIARRAWTARPELAPVDAAGVG